MQSSSEADRACGGLTDCAHTLANEPSLGLYYVMEHIQRSVPALVADKAEVRGAAEALRGAGLDVGYALDDMRAATAGGTQRALRDTVRLAAQAAERLRQT